MVEPPKTFESLKSSNDKQKYFNFACFKESTHNDQQPSIVKLPWINLKDKG
jgi:hypothetical protein